MTKLYVCPLVDTDATERVVVVRTHTHTQLSQLTLRGHRFVSRVRLCVPDLFFVRSGDGAAGWRDAAILPAMYPPGLPFLL